MADIFLSYATKDRDRVRPIAEAFISLGYRIFWDTQIKPGERWDAVIDAELKNARCIVVIWSQESIKSTWVPAEAHHGYKRNTLIPILIDNVVDGLPVPFQVLQSANLVGVNESQLPSHPEFLRVIQSLQDLLRSAASKNRASQEESRGAHPEQVQSRDESHHEQPRGNQRDTTAEPVQVKSPSPRRSTPGCMIAALLLIVVAIGLTASSNDPPKEPKDRSILASLVDGLTNSPPSGPLTPVTAITPAPSMHTSSEGIPGLRRLHGVRTLQDTENGKTLSQIPSGTFGFIEPQSPEHLLQARVRNTPALSPVEIHKLANGSLMLIGFARDSEVRSLTQGGRSRLTLFRTASAQARSAVAIPIGWVRSVLLTAQGEIMLDLSSVP
jgi:hypothetical protein